MSHTIFCRTPQNILEFLYKKLFLRRKEAIYQKHDYIKYDILTK